MERKVGSSEGVKALCLSMAGNRTLRSRVEHYDVDGLVGYGSLCSLS